MTGQTAKLDMMATWRQSLALLKGHWTLFSAIAGPLVFLPLAGAFLRLASSDVNWTSKNQALVEQQLIKALESDAWIYGLAALIVMLGQLAMLVLVLHEKRPTVGQSLWLALVMLPSYFLAYMAVQLVTTIPSQLVANVPGIAAIGGFILSVTSIILMVRTYVLAPIYAVGGSLNPWTNMKASWAMTKGNAAAIFIVLLIVGIGTMVSGFMLWLILSLAIGLALPMSAAPAVMLTLLAIIMTLGILLFVVLSIAMYQQLAIGHGHAQQ